MYLNGETSSFYQFKVVTVYLVTFGMVVRTDEVSAKYNFAGPERRPVKLVMVLHDSEGT